SAHRECALLLSAYPAEQIGQSQGRSQKEAQQRIELGVAHGRARIASQGEGEEAEGMGHVAPLQLRQPFAQADPVNETSNQLVWRQTQRAQIILAPFQRIQVVVYWLL